MTEPQTEAGRRLPLGFLTVMASDPKEHARMVKALAVAIEQQARADLAAAAKAVLAQAEPDDDFDGQFVDYIVPHDAIEALRDAIREASDDRA